MSSAICFNLDQSKILFSGNGLINVLHFDVWLKKINLLPNEPLFSRLHYTSFVNTMGKGEIAHNDQFLLFLQCFLCFWSNFYHFKQIQSVVCQLFQFGSLEIVAWERG